MIWPQTKYQVDDILILINNKNNNYLIIKIIEIYYNSYDIKIIKTNVDLGYSQYRVYSSIIEEKYRLTTDLEKLKYL